MIKKIYVKNFQKIKELELVIDSGITTVIGESYEGKSALANRSIKFCLFMTAIGNEFIRHGQKECSIKITFEKDNSEHTIERVKTLKTSYYIIDGNKLEKSGTSLGIDLIKEFFNINISSVNILDQFDPHFFINLSPNQAGKELIDYYKMINILEVSEVKKIELKNIKNELSKKLEEKEKLNFWLNENSKKYSDYILIKERMEKYDLLVKTKNLIKTYLENKDNFNILYKNILELKTKKELVERYWKYVNIKNILSSYLDNISQKKKCIEQVKRINSIKLLSEKYNKLLKNKEILENFLFNKVKLSKLKINIENLKKQLIGKSCPLCGQHIKF